MSQPVIGIVVDAKFDAENQRTQGVLSLNWNYAQVLADAGAVPLLIPPQADASVVMSLLDGLMIPGGADIDARHFGQEAHPKSEPIENERFDLEERLLKAMPAQMPYLGVCYGCQRINVFRGGDLVQHVPDLVGHEAHSGGTLQDYEISKSILSGIVGASARGESWHHQVVGRMGSGLSAVAASLDETIEAIEDSRHPFCIGVQWHPERTPDAPDSKALFRAFVQAAREYKAQK